MSHYLRTALFPLILATAPALAQSATDRLTPTIPESQIEPAPLSSPFEFLSVATSASDFVIEASMLASSHGAAEEVKAIASRLAASHATLKNALRAAGQQDRVEVAKPSMDGEQTGLLGKLQPLQGEAFDVAYLDAQIFVHQRTIAYYRGYSRRQDALGTAAQALLPTLVSDYAQLVAMAEKHAQTRPAAQ